MGKVIDETSYRLTSKGYVKEKNTFTILKTLGEGGQGRTEIIERHRDRKTLVRKIQRNFEWIGNEAKEAFIFEKILKPHPSIVLFDHANLRDKDQWLTMYFEHCSGGDLQDWIDKYERPTERFLWQVFIQLADALAYLHYGVSRKYGSSRPPGWRRIVHRDVKPGNVFLRRKITTLHSTPDVVLGDFGLATLDEVSYDCGTYSWWGPEIPKSTKDGDVWGLGAIIHALAHGKPPISPCPRGYNSSEWNRSPKARKPIPLPSNYSDKLNRNMLDCLTMDPKKRVSSNMLLDNLEREMPKRYR